jgi:hypothetical protein
LSFTGSHYGEHIGIWVYKRVNIEHKNEKEKLKKEDGRRLRLTLTTEQSVKEMQVIGTLAIPVFRHSFGIINWHQEETQNWTEKQGKC